MGGSSIGADTVPHWHLEVRIRNMRGKTLVAGPYEARELDETAAFIWRQIDGTRTIRQIAEVVASEYDVDAGTALADVAELVADLVGCQAIEVPAPSQ